MSDRQAVVDTYMDNYFFRFEGEQGVRNLETMCEHLGYGQCYMTGNAIVDMLQDNPGAVEAVAEFLADWAVRNTEWNTALEEVLDEDRVEIE